MVVVVSDLDEEPGGDQGQTAVLTVEAVVIGVEGKVVQIKEPEKHKDDVQTHTHYYILKHITYISLQNQSSK